MELIIYVNIRLLLSACILEKQEENVRNILLRAKPVVATYSLRHTSLETS